MNFLCSCVADIVFYFHLVLFSHSVAGIVYVYLFYKCTCFESGLSRIIPFKAVISAF